MLYPLLKLAKPYLRIWFKNVAIPEIKKATKFGKVDEAVDNAIEKAITTSIDLI